MKDIVTDPQVMEAILKLAAEIIGMLGLLLTPLLLRWFKAHGVQIDESQAKQLEVIAAQAAAYAEEWARAKAKGGVAPSGSEKAAKAIDAARQLATGTLAKLSSERLGVAIHAALPILRAQSTPPPAGENPYDPKNGL